MSEAIQPGIPHNGKPVKDLRDEFAMAALQGLMLALSSPEANSAFIRGFESEGKTAEDFSAQTAYRIADSMLKARYKAGTP